MSEEVLKALMQLFAIIARQEDGATEMYRRFVENFLNFQLASENVSEYLEIYDGFFNEAKPSGTAVTDNKKPRRTPLKDSVRTLGICKDINKTLSQKQKVVVLARLLELLKIENQLSDQRFDLINAVSLAFNIPEEEKSLIHQFIVTEDPCSIDHESMLVIHSMAMPPGEIKKRVKHIYSEGLSTDVVAIIYVRSVDLYFAKYKGNHIITINGLNFDANVIYLFAPGSNIRLPKGTVYFSDIVSRFLYDKNFENTSLTAKNIFYKFPNNKTGLHDISLSESLGCLVAIMGASGAGKTTLLNILSGFVKPSQGTVEINGIDLHKDPKKLQGITGYISQDDLLIEELTVYENLFYNTQLCFDNLTEREIKNRVVKTLNNLGLFESKNIRVGNPLDKKISGGQRKRLNIALELIREPTVLFVDEPTSGLSSADSENVMDLLKELTFKGKLIFVVIHQPSSDIYKMFDKLILLDVGGFPVFYGNPIDAVTYLKKQTNQLKSDVGECLLCGNVNPEQLFVLVEAKVVDEYGQFKTQRKIKPSEWHERYKKEIKIKLLENSGPLPKKTFQIPGKLKQLSVFIKRDLVSKLSNQQYILINLLEAPLLALILSLIIRYVGNPETNKYSYRENDNIPAYIFMCIIISMFIGLTLSAMELFKDKKLLKRERLLNLSKLSYLFSKITILFSLSAIQMFLLVLIGNGIIGIKGMFFSYWITLFTIACFSNVLGLIISDTFNSAITIYILIPLLVIPQMILGGAMFSFDKINDLFGGGAGRKTPIIADFMASRWAFEGLSVHMFKDNPYSSPFFELNKMESLCKYKQAYYFPKMEEIISDCHALKGSVNTNNKEKVYANLITLKNEVCKQMILVETIKFDLINELDTSLFTNKTATVLSNYLHELKDYYSHAFISVHQKKEALMSKMNDTELKKQHMALAFDDYNNESLNDLLTKANSKTKIIQIGHCLIQNVDPVYLSPANDNLYNFRTHFFAPDKHFLTIYFDTFKFNLVVIWCMTVLLFLILYYNLIKKAQDLFKFSFNRNQ